MEHSDYDSCSNANLFAAKLMQNLCSKKASKVKPARHATCRCRRCAKSQRNVLIPMQSTFSTKRTMTPAHDWVGSHHICSSKPATATLLQTSFRPSIQRSISGFHMELQDFCKARSKSSHLLQVQVELLKQDHQFPLQLRSNGRPLDDALETVQQLEHRGHGRAVVHTLCVHQS